MTRFWILLFILAATLSAGAHAQQSLFDRANDLMDDQQVEEALDIYRSIEEEGHLSGMLYFNMGLASIYKDSLGLAKYYFLQSEQYPDTRAEAGAALRFVDEQFSRRSPVLPALPWEAFLQRAGDIAGATGLLFLGIILFNIGVGSVIGSWFINRSPHLLRYGGYTAALFSLLLISSSFYLQYLEERFQTGVMVENQSGVYHQPSNNSATVNTAYEGYTMSVDIKTSQTERNWYYVRLANGMYGWIERERVRTF